MSIRQAGIFTVISFGMAVIDHYTHCVEVGSIAFVFRKEKR